MWAGGRKVKADAADVRHGTNSKSPTDVFSHLFILYNQPQTHRLFVSNVCDVYNRYTLKLRVIKYTASTVLYNILFFRCQNSNFISFPEIPASQNKCTRPCSLPYV
jgi:hypothetical protein